MVRTSRERFSGALRCARTAGTTMAAITRMQNNAKLADRTVLKPCSKGSADGSMGMGLVLNFLIAVWIQSSAACVDAGECRRQSTEAAARGDVEQAHDLAWRAVQKGRPNDPDTMLVLARAQSLSGRPSDALVMLGRIVALGLKPDVATDPDFRRVRELPGWSEFEARLNGAAAPFAPSAPK